MMAVQTVNSYFNIWSKNMY